MIGWFRRSLSSWMTILILGLAVIAFIITGVGTGDPFGGGGAGQGAQLAKIGKDSLSEFEATEQMDRVVRNARQQNPTLDNATFVQEGGFDQVLEQMISAKAIEGWGRKLGFGASKPLVDAEIASVPAFQVAGKFDQASYEQALRAQRLSDRNLRSGLEGDIIRRQVLVPITANAQMSTGLARPYATLLLEERTGRIGLIPARAFAQPKPPSDAEVRAFYDKNKSLYLTPERRSFRYAIFGPDTMDVAAPTDAEIEQFRKANAASFETSEKRVLSQVVLPDEAAAKAFVAEVDGGKSFAAAASGRGFGAHDIAVGETDQASFAADTAPAVAAAAFGARQGGIAGPVQSPFGWHVVKVDEIRAAAQRAPADIRAEVTRELARHKQEEALASLVARVDDQLADGGDLTRVAQENGLTLVEVSNVDARGERAGDPAYQLPEPARALLRTVFQSDPEADAVVEDLPDGRFALLNIDEAHQAAVAPFEQVKEQAAVDLARRTAYDKAKATADQIVAKVKAGADLDKALADAKMPPAQRGNGRRLDISRAEQVPPPLTLMFTLPENGVRVLPADNEEGLFIVKVDEIKAGDLEKAPGLLDATRDQFGRVVGDEYAAQFVSAIRREVGVKINEKAVSAFRDRLSGGGSARQ